jgi:hypothetical protein
MGWRFYRRVRIAPGLTLNLGKRNVSMSLGVRGAHVTVGTAGTRATLGLPGTGLYCTLRIGASPPPIALGGDPPPQVPSPPIPAQRVWRAIGLALAGSRGLSPSPPNNKSIRLCGRRLVTRASIEGLLAGGQ